MGNSENYDSPILMHGWRDAVSGFRKGATQHGGNPHQALCAATRPKRRDATSNGGCTGATRGLGYWLWRRRFLGGGCCAPGRDGSFRRGGGGREHDGGTRRAGSPCCCWGRRAAARRRFPLALGEKFNGEIVSCDSVAVYRGMDPGFGQAVCCRTGAAAPSPDRRGRPGPAVYRGGSIAGGRGLPCREIAGRGQGADCDGGGRGLYLRALTDGLFAGAGAAGRLAGAAGAEPRKAARRLAAPGAGAARSTPRRRAFIGTIREADPGD